MKKILVSGGGGFVGGALVRALVRKGNEVVVVGHSTYPDLEGIGVVGMVLNFVVAIAVSKMTASPPVEIRKLVDSIRVPRGAGDAHAH